MENTWMRSGEGPAHWIKLFGSTLLATSCSVVLPREKSGKVETVKRHLAQRPGVAYAVPKLGIETCQACLANAERQA